MVAAAGEAPVAREPVSAVNSHRFSDRRIRAARNGARIGPVFVLRLFGHRRHKPLVDDTEAEHPAGRAATRRHLGDDRDQRVKAVFVAAVDRGRHDPEQAGVAHPLDRFGGDLPVRFGLFRLFADESADFCRARDQIADARPRHSGFNANDRHINDPGLSDD